MFHSDQIQGNGDNFMSYRNEELDRLIEQARRTIDHDKRMAMWRRCHEIMHEDQPYTFLSWGESLRFVNPRLKNLEVKAGGLTPATDWYIPQALQKN
jgi:peptide/nickel transport system substrate-binding protein